MSQNAGNSFLEFDPEQRTSSTQQTDAESTINRLKYIEVLKPYQLKVKSSSCIRNNFCDKPKVSLV